MHYKPTDEKSCTVFKNIRMENYLNLPEYVNHVVGNWLMTF